MANMHKHKPRILRGVDDETWSDLGREATAAHTDRSAVIRAFIGWYLLRPGAELPERPAMPSADA